MVTAEVGGLFLLTGEMQLIAALRAGDECAFRRLVEKYHMRMVHLARTYVADSAIAEEVAQEAWVGVLRGLSRFEGRSSLQTWIFTILSNCALARALRERRTVPFCDLLEEDEEGEPVIDSLLFHSNGRRHGHWLEPPARWADLPEAYLLAQETLDVAQRTIERLPPNQRAVILLRDVDGLSAAEVCDVLQSSAPNQRVLLHRARTKIQRALSHYFNAS